MASVKSSKKREAVSDVLKKIEALRRLMDRVFEGEKVNQTQVVALLDELATVCEDQEFRLRAVEAQLRIPT